MLKALCFHDNIVIYSPCKSAQLWKVESFNHFLTVNLLDCDTVTICIFKEAWSNHSLMLLTLSSVPPSFGLPLFPLCKSPIDSLCLNLRTILEVVFLCGGFDA